MSALWMFPVLKHLLMPRLKELDDLCKYTYNASYTVNEKLPHVSFETYLRSSSNSSAPRCVKCVFAWIVCKKKIICQKKILSV